MKERNIYLDNLKAILIFFVVLGHFAQLNREIPIFGVINNLIYSFHMPLFIFVSGYLSKKIVSARKKEITQILYAYIVFELVNLLFSKLTSLGCGSYNVFYPSCQNWYLLGIFFWRLFLPYFQLFRKDISFFITAVIATVIGFSQDFGYFLGLYRAIYFMPFFLLGYYCHDINLFINKYSKWRVWFFMTLFVSFTIILSVTLIERDYNFAVGYAYTPYKGYYSPNTKEMLLRFILRISGFVSSLIISFCFLFTVPNKKIFFSKYGRNTLNIYLLHMFIVWPICWLFKEFNLDILLMLIASLLSSILLVRILSTNIVNEIMAPLTDVYKMLSIIKLKR